MSTGVAQPFRVILWVCIVVSLIIVTLELRMRGRKWGFAREGIGRG